jgi:hypothetical protein
VIITSSPTPADPNLVVTLNPEFSVLNNVYNYRIAAIAEGGASAFLDLQFIVQCGP